MLNDLYTSNDIFLVYHIRLEHKIKRTRKFVILRNLVMSHMEYCLCCISFSKLPFLQTKKLVGKDVHRMASHIENATVSHDTSVSIDIY